jgi:hypothetical protein
MKKGRSWLLGVGFVALLVLAVRLVSGQERKDAVPLSPLLEEKVKNINHERNELQLQLQIFQRDFQANLQRIQAEQDAVEADALKENRLQGDSWTLDVQQQPNAMPLVAPRLVRKSAPVSTKPSPPAKVEPPPDKK